jgi:DNA-binding response OmpR family regulator
MEKRKRILVIDDEPAIADSLTQVLNQAGYEAIAFLNGHAAIDSVRQMCPDIVLADVMMPKLNGIETVLMIREICPVTRILLFSGQSDTETFCKRQEEKVMNLKCFLSRFIPISFCGDYLPWADF